MNLDRFEKLISDLGNLFREKGFYKDPNSYEIDLFVKFIDFHSQAVIITSRLEEDIAEFESFNKTILKNVKEKGEIPKTEIEKHSLALPKIMLDLSDFYIYTRIFLDTLTLCIKRSFKSAGNKNWNIMEHSITCLLNKDKLDVYKSKIDFEFFENLGKKLIWIGDFRKTRNGLLHHYYHFVFTTTRQGDLGYDISDRIKTAWGTDTVKGILSETQNIIDRLTDLIDYLLANIPLRVEDSG